MTQQNYIAETTQNTNGSVLRITGPLHTWTQSMWFTDFDPDGSLTGDDGFWLFEAWQLIDEIPDINDPHPKYADARCSDAYLVPDSEDTSNGFRAMVTWIKPGGWASGQFDNYQQTEEQNFAVDDTSTTSVPNSTLTFVEYTPTGANAGTLPNIKVPFVAGIRVPVRLGAIRITQYNTLPDLTPADIADTTQAIWNNDEVFGYGIGELLFISKQCSNVEGTDVYRITYTFLYNPYGWHHFYAVYVYANGLKPPDITPIDPTTVQPNDGTVRQNGAAAFRMLVDAEFATYFQEIKPPFGPGGDFVP